MTREEIIARIAQLEAENEAAPGWGAAVGARLEEIQSLKRQLDRPRSLTISELKELLAKAEPGSPEHKDLTARLWRRQHVYTMRAYPILFEAIQEEDEGPLHFKMTFGDKVEVDIGESAARLFNTLSTDAMTKMQRPA